MKENWKCRLFGHYLIPIFIKSKTYKFIGCYCKRCWLGYDELLDFVRKREPIINTHSKEYWG